MCAVLVTTNLMLKEVHNMLVQQDITAMKALSLSGMASVYHEKHADADFSKLSIDEAVSILVDAQVHDEEQRTNVAQLGETRYCVY